MNTTSKKCIYIFIYKAGIKYGTHYMECTIYGMHNIIIHVFYNILIGFIYKSLFTVKLYKKKRSAYHLHRNTYVIKLTWKIMACFSISDMFLKMESMIVRNLSRSKELAWSFSKKSMKSYRIKYVPEIENTLLDREINVWKNSN